MKNNLIEKAGILLTFFLVGLPAHAGSIEYQFKWEIGSLPFEVKMFQAPLSMAGRVGEQGELVDMQSMPVLAPIEKSLKVKDIDSTVMYLVLKNKSKNTIHFSVVPHSIQPAEASLGMDFRCLCYGHVYTIKPNGLWYRIMRVTHTITDEKDRVIQLSHKIFKTKKPDKPPEKETLKGHVHSGS